MVIDVTLTSGFVRGLVEAVRANNHGPRSVTIIARGEAGANARPMHPDWATALRDECAKAEINFKFAGWGAWIPMARKPALKDRREMFLHSQGMTAMANADNPFDPWDRGHPNWQPMRKVSAKVANATPLDWRTPVQPPRGVVGSLDWGCVHKTAS